MALKHISPTCIFKCINTILTSLPTQHPQVLSRLSIISSGCGDRLFTIIFYVAFGEIFTRGQSNLFFENTRSTLFKMQEWLTVISNAISNAAYTA
jgi:hypothetical protein